MKLKMMFVALTLCCSMLFIAPLASEAGVAIYVDGNQVTFNQQPFVDMQSQRTMVPFRGIFEALGADVWFNEELNAAVGSKGDLKIELPINRAIAVVNGEIVDLDTPSRVINGSTMVPLRFISENLGCNVQAEGDLTNLTVYINSAGQYDQPYDLGPGFSKADLTPQQREFVQNTLNALGPVPKNDLSFNGFNAYYMEDGSLAVEMFIRNGFNYPIWNLQCTLDVIVDDQLIASGYVELPDHQFGVLANNMSRVWTIRFVPEDVYNYDADLSYYTLQWNVEYQY